MVGNGFRLECKKCRIKRPFSIGFGFAHMNINSKLIKSSIEEKQTQEEVISRINRNLEPNEFGNVLMQCPKCDLAHVKFYMKFDDGYETKYKCDCGGDLVQMPSTSTNIYSEAPEWILESKCPNCGSNEHEVTAVYMWD